MQPSHPVHLTGELRAGRGFPELHTAGGAVWELESSRAIRRLIGRRVEVIGRPVGFNDLLCEQIWPAGEPRPARGVRRAWPTAAILVAGLVLIAVLLVRRI